MYVVADVQYIFHTGYIWIRSGIRAEIHEIHGFSMSDCFKGQEKGPTKTVHMPLLTKLAKTVMGEHMHSTCVVITGTLMQVQAKLLPCRMGM